MSKRSITDFYSQASSSVQIAKKIRQDCESMSPVLTERKFSDESCDSYVCKSDSDDLKNFFVNDEFSECNSSDEELQDGEEESNESEDYPNTGTDSDFVAKPKQVLAPVSKASGPSDISHILTEGPKQPKLNFYRKTEFGVGNNKRWRSFSNSWFDIFPWLEYSVLNDAAFCFPCRLFSVNWRKTIYLLMLVLKIGKKLQKRMLVLNSMRTARTTKRAK